MPPLWWHVFEHGEGKPTHDLAAIKAAETPSITSSALRDAVGLGFDRGGIAKVIQTIERHMFYKSMTAHADHRVWQDVYHLPKRTS